MKYYSKKLWVRTLTLSLLLGGTAYLPAANAAENEFTQKIKPKNNSEYTCISIIGSGAVTIENNDVVLSVSKFIGPSIKISNDDYYDGVMVYSSDATLNGLRIADQKEHTIENSEINISIGESKQKKQNPDLPTATAALLVTENSTLTITDSNVNISSKFNNWERKDSDTQANNGIYVETSSTLNIYNSNVKVDVRNRDNNIKSREKDKSDALTTNDESSKLYVNYKSDDPSKYTIQLDGSIDGNGVYVKLANPDSYWYGSYVYKIENGEYTEKSGVDNGVIISNGAEWVPTDDNERGNAPTPNVFDETDMTASYLTLKNGGIVNLSTENYKSLHNLEDIQRDVGTNHSVTIENLKGSGGIFKLDLNYLGANGEAQENKNGNDNMQSDYVHVINSADGIEHYVDFKAEASNIDKMQEGDKLYFADVEKGDLNFKSLNKLENASAANIYNYEYDVSKEAEADKTYWFIGLTGKQENENVTGTDGAMKAGFALGRELDRLNKRLGEARYLSDDKGMWVRYRHARVGVDSSFKSNSNMFQLGYDKEAGEKDGKHYRGGALDYTHADTSLLRAGGSGENDRYSLSLYDTWLGEKGHYRDLVIRGGRINSEYDLYTRGQEIISSDYHQWFASISGEWGRKKDTGHDWYFEPQAQLQLARIGGADYVTNYGVCVEQDAATSITGRLGFRLGREYDKQDAAKRDNYYIKADLLHEFCGDLEYKVSGSDGSLARKLGGKDTWFDIGAGADITISRDTYFWIDVERTLGGDFDRTWQVSGGFRWEWK